MCCDQKKYEPDNNEGVQQMNVVRPHFYANELNFISDFSMLQEPALQERSLDQVQESSGSMALR